MLKHLGRILAALLLIGSAHGQGLGIGSGIDDVPPPYAGVAPPPPACTPFGPGCPGFLSTCSGTFAITNNILQSQSFVTSPWALATEGTGSASSLTANAATAPDNTLTATKLTMPAVSGAGNASFLYQPVSTIFSFPEVWDIYIKGAVGGETLYINANSGVGDFVRTAITATTSWQRVSLKFYPGGQNVSGGAITEFLEIGTDLRDAGQSATSAQNVFIWGAQLVGQYQEFTYVPTTTAAVTQNQTVSCPSGVAFRDFSSLAAYSGNPIIPQNTGTYNAGGVSNVFTNPWSSVGGTIFGWANCTVTGANRSNWPNQCFYKGPDQLHWTDQSASNPIVTETASTWDDHYLLHPSLSPVCTTNTYCMYLSAFDASNHWSIGLFSAASLSGPWTNYASNPVISGTQIQLFNYPGLPSIATVGSNTYMYTAYLNNTGTFAGVWQRVSDTSWTFLGPSALVPLSTDWDNTAVIYDPFVFKNKHGFYEMVYTAAIAGNQSLAYAVSADGLTWYKYAPASILTFTAGCPAGQQIGDGVFSEDGTTFFLTGNCDDASTISTARAYTLSDF